MKQSEENAEIFLSGLGDSALRREEGRNLHDPVWQVVSEGRETLDPHSLKLRDLVTAEPLLLLLEDLGRAW